MALQWRDTESKKVAGKRNIKITNVVIENGYFVDEEGNIANRLKEVLPDGTNIFDLKLSFNLDDEEEVDDGDEDAPF